MPRPNAPTISSPPSERCAIREVRVFGTHCRHHLLAPTSGVSRPKRCGTALHSGVPNGGTPPERAAPERSTSLSGDHVPVGLTDGTRNAPYCPRTPSSSSKSTPYLKSLSSQFMIRTACGQGTGPLSPGPRKPMYSGANGAGFGAPADRLSIGPARRLKGAEGGLAPVVRALLRHPDLPSRPSPRESAPARGATPSPPAALEADPPARGFFPLQ